MTQSFQCPNCQASLEYDEAGALTVQCAYCGSTVIVPEALRERDEPQTAGSGMAGDLSQYVRLNEVAQLIRLGRKIEAIKLMREITGLGLKEAKEAVERMEQGLPVQLNSVVVQQSGMSSYAGGETAVSSGSGGSSCLLGFAILLIGLIGAGAFFLVNPTTVGESEAIPGAVAEVIETAESSLDQVLPTATPGFAAEKLAFGGEEGTGPGFFNDTRSIGLDGEGNIYTGDYDGGRIQVFDAAGSFKAQWSLADPDTLLLSMAVDREGRVYTIERGDIYRYDDSGDPPQLFAGGAGAGFEDLAITPDGTVIAYAFLPPDTLIWYDADGNEIRRVAEILSSQTGDPEPAAQVAVDGAGNVYLLGETFTRVVFKFDAAGQFITRIGSEGDESGQFRTSTSIAVGNQGRIYVDDFDGILVFGNDGRYLDTIPFRGVAFDMAVNDQNDLVVMDRNGNRVVVYELVGR